MFVLKKSTPKASLAEPVFPVQSVAPIRRSARRKGQATPWAPKTRKPPQAATEVAGRQATPKPEKPSRPKHDFNKTDVPGLERKTQMHVFAASIASSPTLEFGLK
ncbi:hypothetical protein D6833_01865 [Candidatus Parcubacteria bacterium]|nr:MAG: hypothetical protein D6833_01865 [Candidatus Parcubacteria bacterium]